MRLYLSLALLISLSASVSGEFFDSLIGLADAGGPALADAINKIADPIASFLNGQDRSNENGTKAKYRNFLWRDKSNEGLYRATPQKLITRAGFRYKNYYVLADDGYITQAIRIINPLADQKKLKKPPVMFFHGGIIDSTAWIWGSNIQTHPEKFPRDPNDWPMTSYNRSLAFVLANNGYDVWLVGTRGSNSQNQGYVNPERFGRNLTEARLLRPSKNFGSSLSNIDYWSYSMDEIVLFELPRQIDLVLTVTGAPKVTLVAISLGSMNTLSLLISNKKYAAKVHTHVQVGAIINNKGTNNLVKNTHRLAVSLPDFVGITLFTDIITSQATRDLLSAFNSVRLLRYTLNFILTRLLVGPGPTYQTNLESAVVGHLFQPTSFVEAKHWSQQVRASNLQRFDYGPKQNMILFNNVEPPVYHLERLRTPNWLLVSGGKDALATPMSTKQILRDSTSSRPTHLNYPHLNHLDLVASVEVDKVNLDILQYIENQSSEFEGDFEIDEAALVDTMILSAQLEQKTPKKLFRFS